MNETNQTPEEITAKFEEPKQLTEGEIKLVRKKYVTIHHPRVIICKHRLDLRCPPRHANCQHCWFAFFNNHGKVVQQLDEMHTAGEDRVIVALQGVKFLHRWLQFMATIAQWKTAQEINEQVSNAGSSDSTNSTGA